MQAVRHIEHRWVRSAIADRHWTLRLHADAGSLGSAQELLLVFHDEVLVAANRLAMLEFQLLPAAFGSVEFAQLFPDLLRQPSGAPHQTLAGNQRHYYSLLEAPQRRVSALRSVSPPAEGMTNSIRRRCAFSMPVFPVRDRRNRLRQGALQPTPVSREPLAQRQLRGDQLRGAA